MGTHCDCYALPSALQARRDGTACQQYGHSHIDGERQDWYYIAEGVRVPKCNDNNNDAHDHDEDEGDENNVGSDGQHSAGGCASFCQYEPSYALQFIPQCSGCANKRQLSSGCASFCQYKPSYTLQFIPQCSGCANKR